MKRGYKERKVVSVLFNTTRVFLNLTSEEACASYITTVCDKFDSKVDSGLKAFTYEDFVGLYHSFCITEEESMPSDVHNRLEHTCNRAYDKFFERLQTEATRAFCLVDGRHRNYPDNASFLGETFKAYSEAREQSELAKQGNMLDLGMALSDLESEMKAHGLEA